MPYQILYDVAKVGYRNWWFPASGLGMAVAVWLIANVSKNWPHQPRNRSLSLVITIGFCLVWSLATFGLTFADYLHLRNALVSGKCERIEGRVTQFVPQKEGDHEPESFVVNGRQFSYSFSTVTAGFNQTHTHNGPIREGLRVRLAVVGDEIARVEAEEKAKP